MRSLRKYLAQRDFFRYLYWVFFAGKGRLYPAYSLSGSEGEAEQSPLHQHRRSLQRRRQRPPAYQEPADYQHTYQQPYCQQLPSSAGLSDTPTSENASDATLTDSELALARDSTLLVHNGKFSGVMVLKL